MLSKRNWSVSIGNSHYAGPTGKILGKMKPVEDPKQTDPEYAIRFAERKAFHYELVCELVKYWALRSAGFQLKRFVKDAGYTDEDVAVIARRTWDELPKDIRNKLRDSSRYMRSATPWWYHAKKDSDGGGK